jgi:O-antigen/teichoic acid export membrane protein
VAIAFAVGATTRLVLSAWLLGRRIRRPRWTFPGAARRDLRSRSLPFTAQDIFGLVIARVDVLLLSALATDAVVGLYGAAYRLLDSTAFIAVALSGAFAAMYTYLGPDTTPTVGAVFQRSVKLALVALVPIAVTFGVLAEPVSRAFFGAELEEAADPLRLLAPVVVLFGVMVLSSALVVSRTNPTRMLKIVAVAAAANLALNLVLIPPLDEVGAALAMLLAELLYVALALRLAVQVAGGIDWRSVLAAPLLAGLAMAGPMLLLGDSLAVAVVSGVAVYVAVAVAVEHLTGGGDLRFAIDVLRRRLTVRRGKPQPGSA